MGAKIQSENMGGSQILILRKRYILQPVGSVTAAQDLP